MTTQLTPVVAPPPVRADIVTPAPRDRWRAVLAADPSALVSQSPEWVDAVCAGGRYRDASRHYLTPHGELVLPLVRRNGPAGRRGYHASMPPAWGMGGILSRGELRPADVAGVVADLRALGALITNVRPNPLLADAWRAGVAGRGVGLARRAHVVDLRDGPEAVWDAMTRSARKTIRRAERLGVEVEVDDTGRLMQVFVELQERSVARWAAQQHEPLVLARWRARRRDPAAKLLAMAQALGPACQVWVARVDGRPAAASVVLLGRNASATRGAMDKELVGSTGANELIEWRALRAACEQGCRHYHLGESGRNAGLAHYKEKFGAVPVDYAEYRIERLPFTAADAALRRIAKTALRFRDV